MNAYRQDARLVVQRAHLLKVMRIVIIAIYLPQLLFAPEVSGQDANAAQMRMQLRSKYNDARLWQCGPCTVRHTVATQWEGRLARRYGHFVRILETQFHDASIVLPQCFR